MGIEASFQPQENYGDAFADVYDAWYANVTNVEATASTLARLAGAGDALELGIGTGRIALPLAIKMPRWARVVGIDSSQAMLDLCAAKISEIGSSNAGASVELHLGDMAYAMPEGRFSLVFCTFNTFFNLDTEEAQRHCLHEAARRLAPGGAVVLEVITTYQPLRFESRPLVGPAERPNVRSEGELDPVSQIASGEFLEDLPDGTVRKRPWRIRYATPAQIDQMAHDAGLVCTDRWEDFSLSPFHERSARQVCVMRHRILS